jgi:hypothetical protein
METEADFLPITHFNSPQTKCYEYIITVSNGLSQIVTSYLDIKCIEPSRYSLHRHPYKTRSFLTSNGKE